MGYSTMSDMPQTLDEALNEKAKLVVEIQDIQVQLGNRNRTNEQGERLEGKTYWEWRNKATWALAQKQKRVAALKAFIREESKKKTQDKSSDLSMLQKAYKLLEFIKNEDGLHEAEEPTVKEIGDYLRDRGALT